MLAVLGFAYMKVKGGLKGPKVKGPSADVDVGCCCFGGKAKASGDLKIGGKVKGPSCEVKVKGPSVGMKIKGPSCEADIQVDVAIANPLALNADIEVDVSAEVKAPKVKGPSCEVKVKGPSCEVKSTIGIMNGQATIVKTRDNFVDYTLDSGSVEEEALSVCALV